jgi:hypothetical protein
MCGHDHLIPVSDFESSQHEFDGIGAAADSDAVAGIEIGGEFFFKTHHFMAEDVLAAAHHALDGTLDHRLLILAVRGWEGGEFGGAALAHG